MADKKKVKSTAKVVKTQTEAKPKGRVRKVETQRDKAAKTQAKQQAKASKQPKRRARRLLAAIAKPFKKPLHVITWPFRTKPMRLIGRVLGRIFWPKYFRNSWAEIKLVTWPGRRETWKLTLAVIVFAVVFGLAAAGTDFVLDKVIRRIVFRD